VWEWGEVQIEGELKRKPAELLGEIDSLAAKIEGLKTQIAAIDQAIVLYDPGHDPDSAKPKRWRAENSSPIPSELDRIHKNEAILEVLRDAGGPLSTADCTTLIAPRNGAAPDDPSMPRFLTQMSAALNALTKRGRVR
jgi:hypothetical protein